MKISKKKDLSASFTKQVRNVSTDSHYFKRQLQASYQEEILKNIRRV